MRQYPWGRESRFEQTTPIKHWPVNIHLSETGPAALPPVSGVHPSRYMRHAIVSIMAAGDCAILSSLPVYEKGLRYLLATQT